jgi:hypothetical protein
MPPHVANPSVIRAYLRTYSESQLEEILQQALRDHAAGVRITSVSFEGGSSSGTMTGTPHQLIEDMMACLDALTAGQTSPIPRPLGTLVQFNP